MLQQLITYILNNSMLVAGIGTIASGAIFYLIRTIPMHMYQQFINTFTSELRVISYRHDYESINTFLLSIRKDFFSKNYTIGNENTKLIAGYGPGIAIFNGCLITYVKSRIDTNNSSLDNLVMRFLTRDRKVIEAFLAAAEDNVDKDKIKIFKNNHGGWNELPNSIRSRGIDTVFVNNNIKEDLISSIDNFIKSEDYYTRHGIPYKFCAILSGIPGTGKSSLAFAIASHFKKKVYYISSLSNIDNQFETVSENSIVFIEDVDCLNSVKRETDFPGLGETTEKDIPLAALDKMNFHSMLNSIDGVLTPHGLIVIMTTNYLEHLDKALTRKGRVDKIVPIGPLNRETMENMVKHFYIGIEDEKLKTYRDVPYHEDLTGADIQAILMENLDDWNSGLNKIYKVGA